MDSLIVPLFLLFIVILSTSFFLIFYFLYCLYNQFLIIILFISFSPLCSFISHLFFDSRSNIHLGSSFNFFSFHVTDYLHFPFLFNIFFRFLNLVFIFVLISEKKIKNSTELYYTTNTMEVIAPHAP